MNHALAPFVGSRSNWVLFLSMLMVVAIPSIAQDGRSRARGKGRGRRVDFRRGGHTAQMAEPVRGQKVKLPKGSVGEITGLVHKEKVIEATVEWKYKKRKYLVVAGFGIKGAELAACVSEIAELIDGQKTGNVSISKAGSGTSISFASRKGAKRAASISEIRKFLDRQTAGNLAVSKAASRSTISFSWREVRYSRKSPTVGIEVPHNLGGAGVVSVQLFKKSRSGRKL